MYLHTRIESNTKTNFIKYPIKHSTIISSPRDCNIIIYETCLKTATTLTCTINLYLTSHKNNIMNTLPRFFSMNKIVVHTAESGVFSIRL